MKIVAVCTEKKKKKHVEILIYQQHSYFYFSEKLFWEGSLKEMDLRDLSLGHAHLFVRFISPRDLQDCGSFITNQQKYQ